MSGDWRDLAACQAAPDGWFPDTPHAPQAKRICRTLCPVRAECLSFALANLPEYGIWAGFNAVELRRMRRDEHRLWPCAWCGELFVRRSTAAYCGQVCRKAGRVAQQNARERAKRSIRTAAA